MLRQSSHSSNPNPNTLRSAWLKRKSPLLPNSILPPSSPHCIIIPERKSSSSFCRCRHFSIYIFLELCVCSCVTWSWRQSGSVRTVYGLQGSQYCALTGTPTAPLTLTHSVRYHHYNWQHWRLENFLQSAVLITLCNTSTSDTTWAAQSVWWTATRINIGWIEFDSQLVQSFFFSRAGQKYLSAHPPSKQSVQGTLPTDRLLDAP